MDARYELGMDRSSHQYQYARAAAAAAAAGLYGLPHPGGYSSSNLLLADSAGRLGTSGGGYLQFI